MREKWKIILERMVEKLLKLDEFIRIIRVKCNSILMTQITGKYFC